MIDRKAIKMRAKEFAFNNKWLIWKPMLITYLIMFAVGLVLGLVTGVFGITEDSFLYSIIDLGITLITLPLSYGLTLYIMKSIKGEKITLIDAFKNRFKYLLPIFLVTLVTGLLVMIGTILFIIPGIIVAVRLSQIGFIMAESEDDAMKNLNPLKESNRLMKGNGWNFVVFGLSFIGWILLGSLTLGIALIWVMPYITVAQIYYYEELKKVANTQN